MDANRKKRMHVALTPAGRKLALDSISSRRFPLEGVIDLTSDPDEVGPVSLEDDEDSNAYVQDIPGVRSLGIKRHCSNLAHTAPPNLQRSTPIATNRDLLQVAKTLQFSTAEDPVAPLVEGQKETCVSSQEIKREVLTSLSSLSDRGSVGNKEKLKDFAQLIEGGELLQFCKRLKEDLDGHLELRKAFEEKLSEKDIVIRKLREDLRDVRTENETLKEEVAGHLEEKNVLNEKTSDKDGFITKLTKDLEDILSEKTTLIKRHSEEIADLKASFDREKVSLEEANQLYRNLLTDRDGRRDGLISQLKGEIEAFKSRFSNLKSGVSKLFMEAETHIRSSNAETSGQSSQQ